MSAAETSFACAWAFVDELVRGGVRHASVSPGSRSTPLALAAARHPGVSVHVHLDERSGSFFALGLARASDQAVALVCTSGTAAAEFLPAIVEASQSRVPLIVLTADRPPRLRGTGANQTIDQVGLFGRYARAYVEPPTPTDADDEAAWRRAAAGAIEVSERREPPGPVHVNCPFDEPLTPRAPPGARGREVTAPGGPPARGTPSTSDEVARAVEAFVERFDVADGVVVAGTMSPDAAAEVVGMATALRWPLIAEPTSGAASVVERSPVVLTAGLSMIESPAWLHGRRPDVVVQAGAMPTSSAARAVAASARRLVVMDGGALDPDPDGIAAWRTSLPLREISRSIAAALPAAHDRPDTWLGRWRTADRTVRTAIDATLDRWDEPSEMRVARDVAAAVPVPPRRDDRDPDRFGATLFVGNSMPVRDLGAYMSPRPRLRVLANRGASGIDGLVSTALGVARSGTGPTVALLGDLSFLYDVGALLWNARRGIDLVVVVNDNGGGQIFAGLGQHELPADELERLFVTPHRADIEALCRAAGAGHTPVERAPELIPAIREGRESGGVQVIHVAIDAGRDRIRRAELRAAVDDALNHVDPR